MAIAVSEFKVSPCELDPDLPGHLLQHQQQPVIIGSELPRATVLVLVVPE